MATLSLLVQVLLGLYLGLLTGLLPALVSWAMAFVVRYFTGIQVPGFGVVVLALAIAGVQGGLLAFANTEFLTSIGASPVPAGTAVLVILMMALYAHAKGDAMAMTFPKRFSLANIGERTLSADVIDLVGGRGEVTVTVVGDVGDIEGYPTLPEELRASIRSGEWRFPADLPLSELQNRMADRLRREFELVEVSVSIDDRARARVSAAPPLSGLSRRVGADERAVSLSALLPTGLARGDRVDIHADGVTVAGTVVGARCDRPRDRLSTTSASLAPANDGLQTDGASPLADPEPPPTARRPVASGGDGRVTIAVPRGQAATLLRVDGARVVVRSRGSAREFELLSLLRRAGKEFRRLSVGDGSLTGATLGSADVRESYGVAVLAVRQEDAWRFAPGGGTRLHSGDELFAVGTRKNLDRFAEVVD